MQKAARDPYSTAILDFGRNWWREVIIYEIYVQSFQDSNRDGLGDLQGIRRRLHYLKKLGVDMLWLTPFYKSPLKDQGYDISDYKGINPQVGTMADFEELIDAIHDKDMRFMLDVVFNHNSDEHPWFVESKQSKDNPKRDWYFWRPGKMVDGKEKPPNNWSSLFGGPAWTKDETTGEWYLHLFSSSQPDLNWDTPAVREAVADVCEFWLEKGVDGFRMDVINLISKVPGLPNAPVTDPNKEEQSAISFFTNGPNVHKYLHELNTNVLSKRNICTVGEMPCGVDPFQASEYVAHESRELDMVFQFSHIDIDATNGNKWEVGKWTVPELERVFRVWQQHMLGNHGWNALYLENHDQARALARYGTQDPKYRNICAKMLCTLQLTMRGTVFLFQGQELGAVHPKSWKFEEFRDVEAIMRYKEFYNQRKKENPDQEPDMSDILYQIAQRSRDNVRVPMPWCPPSSSKNVGFCDDDVEPWIKLGDYLDEINVESQEKDPHSVLSYYTKLLTLRKMNPAMFYGTYVPLSYDDPKVFSYLRCQGPFRTFIVMNFSSDDGVEFEVKGMMQIDMAVLFISNYEVTDVKLPRVITLRPYEARVYALREQVA